MRLIISFVTVLLLHLSISLQAQLVGDMDDESKLYAETKQVNQFFRRFNGEEDEKGNRYYEKDRKYRNEKLRKQYLQILFDYDNRSLSDQLKESFINDVLDKNDPEFLDFKGGDWFAEVETVFQLNQQAQPITLFLKLEKAHKGTQWSIFKVQCDAFSQHFKRDTTKVYPFIHPMSHELDFMNLRKAFAKKDSINQFTARDFKPDQLSVFIYEMSRGNLKYETVKNVKFHFFQLDNWYFEISQFNRKGYNTGWLISNLTPLKNEQEEELVKNYLFYEN